MLGREPIVDREDGGAEPVGDLAHGGVYVLPPYVKGKSGEWYSGTANAIYQNLSFIDCAGCMGPALI